MNDKDKADLSKLLGQPADDAVRNLNESARLRFVELVPGAGKRGVLIDVRGYSQLGENWAKVQHFVHHYTLLIGGKDFRDLNGMLGSLLLRLRNDVGVEARGWLSFVVSPDVTLDYADGLVNLSLVCSEARMKSTAIG